MSKTIKASAAGSIRLHQATSLSDLSVPVCVSCKDLLRTVDELPESGGFAQINQIMSNMSTDYRTVKMAGIDGRIAAQEIQRVWRGRLARLDEIGLKSEAQKFLGWLKVQASRTPDDVTWEASMRLLHSPQALSGASVASLDMVKLVRNNISMMIEQVPGLKALIVDKSTLGILATSVTSTSLAEQAVVVGPEDLFTCLSRNIRNRHVRAIIWVRPTEDNIQQICKELQNPSFAEYHICFSSRNDRGTGGFVRRLAVADQFEVVREVRECLVECVAISPEMFALEVAPAQKEMSYSERVQRLQSVMLSLGRQPIIRYSTRSEQAAAIAQKLSKSLAAALDLKDVDASGRRLALLIVDREDDPFTPLMNQWSFLAMQHELLLEEGSCGSSRIEYTQTDTGEKHVINRLPPGGAVDFGATFATRHMHDDWGVVCEGYERLKAQRLALKEEIERLNASNSMSDSQRAVRLMKQRDDARHVHDLQSLPLVQEMERRATQQHAQDVSTLQVSVVDGVDAGGNLQQSTDYSNHGQHSENLAHLLKHVLLSNPARPTATAQGQAGGGESGHLNEQGIILQRKRAILTFALRYPQAPPAGEAWLELCTREERDLVRFARQTALRSPAHIAFQECSAARQYFETRWKIDPVLTFRPRLEWTLHRILHKKLHQDQYAFEDGERDELRHQHDAFEQPVRAFNIKCPVLSR
jgi:hypothetical protein